MFLPMRLSPTAIAELCERVMTPYSGQKEQAMITSAAAEWILEPPTGEFEFLGRSQACGLLRSKICRSYVGFASAARDYVVGFCASERAPIRMLQTANAEGLLGTRLKGTHQCIFPLVVDLHPSEMKVYYRFLIKEGGTIAYLGEIPLSL